MAARKAFQHAGGEALSRVQAWRVATPATLALEYAFGTSHCMLVEAGTNDPCRTSGPHIASDKVDAVLESAGSTDLLLLSPCMQFLGMLCPSQLITPSSSMLSSNNHERANITRPSVNSNELRYTQSDTYFQTTKESLLTPLSSTTLKGLSSLLTQTLQASTCCQSNYAYRRPCISRSRKSFSTQAASIPLAAPFPSGIDDFTITWLTDVLRGSKAIGADSAVQSFQPEQVGKGVGLVSSLYSIKVAYIGAPGPHAPPRLVAKFAHPSKEARAFAIRNGSYEREARFYQTFGTRPAATPATVHHHRVPIRTPEIYFCEYDPDAAKLCILMQDVSDCEPLDQIKGATFEESLGVMQDIGRFHALCWDSPDLDTWRWLPQLHEPRFLASDPQEFRSAWPRALKLFPGLIPEHLLHPLSQLPEAAPRLLERLGKAPRALCHGDLRLDNVYIHRGKADADKASPLVAGVAQEPNLLYIDFGDCCAGRGGHDVGYFLSQSLDSAVRRDHEKQLLHAYWGALHGSHDDDVGDMRERLGNFTFEDLVEDYKLGVLYNFCLAVNMANLIEEGKGGERVKVLTKTALERAVQAIEDHNLGELLLEHVS